ncbi:uncharacterized protein LOC127830990 isoform X2 [Dreissena polymorpha]|uniref:Calponin-homology (CH) domain-containing protein n=1 Tax=Dreissena polymorpha TaxID=45954 RepID=A0A9D4GYD2_DREPO|nr:uncharacterized protein LOC127830990 isoform X2 [Dreissena polymorpha]KAH3823706.1 hypothetical protein DPMN_125522 [Dreissena polymorpha]
MSETDLEQFETVRVGALRDEREYIQKKVFTKWANSVLEKAELKINDLFEDLRDGIILIKLLEIISRQPIGKPNRRNLRVQKAENINKCLQFLRTKVIVENIGAEDIMDGNRRLTLGLIWTIIRLFTFRDIKPETEGAADKSIDTNSAANALLLWCQRKTAEYHGVQVTNFTNSWSNGLAFNALIHAHRPDLVDFKKLVAADHVGNLNNAFNVAVNELGIPNILDAEDVDTASPDEKTIMTYVASYYHYFARMKSKMVEDTKNAEDQKGAIHRPSKGTIDTPATQQEKAAKTPTRTKPIYVDNRNVGQKPPAPPPTFKLNFRKSQALQAANNQQKPSLENIDKQVLYAVDDHAIQVSKSDHSNVRELIWDLIYSKNIIDELERVRVIFRWLATKNLNEISFIDVEPGSPEEVLMGLKTRKTSYAKVFDTMCNNAELRSEIIRGYAKGFDYLPGQSFTPGQHEHSWNAVNIFGTWCLFDANWGARVIIGEQDTDENLHYRLDEYYFLAEPAQLIYSHFPVDPKWQLLEGSITLEQFENMPRVWRQFFKYGLEFVSHRTAVVHGRGEINIKLRYPENKPCVAFSFNIHFENGDKEYSDVKLNRYIMHENIKCVASFRLRLPQNGSYYFKIYCKENSPANKDNVYKGVCDYKIVQEEVVGQQTAPFPNCSDRQWGPGSDFLRYGLETEQQTATIFTRNGKVELWFRVPNTMQFKAKLKHNCSSDSELEGYCMYRKVGNTAFVNITAPARGEYGLDIYANDPSSEGTSLVHVAQYMIECKEDVKAEPLPKLPGGYLGEQPKFCQFGLNTLSHQNPVIELEKNSVEIQFSFVQKMMTKVKLVDAVSNEDYPDFVFTQTHGSVISIFVVIPNTGFYKLQIYANPDSDASNQLAGMYNYLINCKKITQPVHPFPKKYSKWNEGCYLETPLSLHRNSGDEVLFIVVVPNATAVAVIAGEEWTYLQTTQPSIWEGKVKLESFYGHGAEVTVNAKYGENTKSYKTLLKYTI